VSWSPAAWPEDNNGAAQRTPELASVVQEIVNGAGWTSGNALALIVTGTGERVAESYDGSAEKAPVSYANLSWCSVDKWAQRTFG